MGQTLTNGIFLPNEGERNCYTGLAGNWRAIDGYIGDYNVHVADAVIHVSQADRDKWDAVTGKADASALTAHTGDTTIHVTAADKESWNGKADSSALTAHTGNTTIHVTAADKEAWNGKADASALTAHTGNTTIHVTAEDKTKWDAVTTKADDSGVMHLSGDETVAGIKSFSNETYIKSLNVTNEVASQSTPSSAILPLIATITYRDETPSATARFNLRITAAGEKSLYPHENNQYSLGLASRRLKEIHTYSLNVLSQINGINPGALSMPSGTSSDVSAYITDLTGQANSFTAPANGWVYVRITGTALRLGGVNGVGQSSTRATAGVIACSVPVSAGDSVTVYAVGTAVSVARFHPCQGNV